METNLEDPKGLWESMVALRTLGPSGGHYLSRLAGCCSPRADVSAFPVHRRSAGALRTVQTIGQTCRNMSLRVDSDKESREEAVG